jgi:hypothetical protein
MTALTAAAHVAVSPDVSIVADEVADLARLIGRTATLAAAAATGDEPEHGAWYVLDTLRDLEPRLIRLRALLSSPVAALALMFGAA